MLLVSACLRLCFSVRVGEYILCVSVRLCVCVCARIEAIGQGNTCDCICFGSGPGTVTATGESGDLGCKVTGRMGEEDPAGEAASPIDFSDAVRLSKRSSAEMVPSCRCRW